MKKLDRYLLELIVDESMGCPIFRKGDKITIDEPAVVPDKTDAMCMAFFADFMPFFRALARGGDPVKIGLAVKGGDIFIECHDPAGRYSQYPTDGGTVRFRIRRIPSVLEVDDRGKVIGKPEWRLIKR